MIIMIEKAEQRAFQILGGDTSAEEEEVVAREGREGQERDRRRGGGRRGESSNTQNTQSLWQSSLSKDKERQRERQRDGVSNTYTERQTVMVLRGSRHWSQEVRETK